MPLWVDGASQWHVEIVAGRGYTFHDAKSNAAFVDFVGPEHALARGFSIAPMFTAGAVGGVPIYGDKYDKTVWFAGGGARLVAWKGFFASFEIGAINSKTPTFSSHYEFATSIGWSYEHFVVTARHISNGGTQGKNYGETMLLAGVRF